ncbi:hypothetical protein [Celeribacter halophilus]
MSKLDLGPDTAFRETRVRRSDQKAIIMFSKGGEDSLETANRG